MLTPAPPGQHRRWLHEISMAHRMFALQLPRAISARSAVFGRTCLWMALSGGPPDMSSLSGEMHLH